MIAQYTPDGFRHVVNCLPLHLRPNVLDESARVEFGIDALQFSSDDQAILCQVEQCALLHVGKYAPLFHGHLGFRCRRGLVGLYN